MKFGCVCGALVYSFPDDTKPIWSSFCHCIDCRSSSGAPLTSNFAVPTAVVKEEKAAGDNLGSHKLKDESPCVRNFCKNCGVSTHGVFEPMKLTFIFHESVKGDQDAYKLFPPHDHIHYRQKVVSVKDGLPKFRAFPPMKPGEEPDLMDE